MLPLSVSEIIDFIILPAIFILVFILVHLCLFVLQGHLISSQLFVFIWGFLFLFDTANCKITIRHVEFERLMCEVEFWEVFLV